MEKWEEMNFIVLGVGRSGDGQGRRGEVRVDQAVSNLGFLRKKCETQLFLVKMQVIRWILCDGRHAPSARESEAGGSKLEAS